MAKSKRDRRTPPKRPGPALSTETAADASGGNGSPGQVSNRQVRKEQARREREALKRKAMRRRTYRRAGIVALALAVAGGIIAGVVVANRPKPSGTLAGLQTGPQPWIAETQDLLDRLDAIGFQCLSQEGTVLHIHQHIDVFVDGQPVTVPEQIGIRRSPLCFSPIHTHTPDGVIHVESPTSRTFTLSEFFDVWGVRFSPRCLGGYCNQGDKTLKVFVNGQPVTGDPRDLKLAAHQEIVVAYGTDKDLPNPIPSSFTFPQGE